PGGVNPQRQLVAGVYDNQRIVFGCNQFVHGAVAGAPAAGIDPPGGGRGDLAVNGGGGGMARLGKRAIRSQWSSTGVVIRRAREPGGSLPVRSTRMVLVFPAGA